MENITAYSWTVKTLHQGPSNSGVFAHLVNQLFHPKGSVSERVNKTARKAFPLRSFRILLRRKKLIWNTSQTFGSWQHPYWKLLSTLNSSFVGVFLPIITHYSEIKTII